MPLYYCITPIMLDRYREKVWTRDVWSIYNDDDMWPSSLAMKEVCFVLSILLRVTREPGRAFQGASKK